MSDDSHTPSHPIDPSRRDVLKVVLAATSLSAGGVMQWACQQQSAAPAASKPATDDLAELGARAVVERIRNGELKTEAYVSRLLERYKAFKDLNAFITVDEARIMEDARAVDRARQKGDKLGP